MARIPVHLFGQDFSYPQSIRVQPRLDSLFRPLHSECRPGYMLDGHMQSQDRSPAAVHRSSLIHHFFLLVISALTFLVHGYHPFADDAGLYVAGAEKLLDPTLFPVGMRFILSETRIESFYPLVIGATRILGGSLASALLLLYLLTLIA